MKLDAIDCKTVFILICWALQIDQPRCCVLSYSMHYQRLNSQNAVGNTIKCHFIRFFSAAPNVQLAAIWYFIAAVIVLCIALDANFVLPFLVSNSDLVFDPDSTGCNIFLLISTRSSSSFNSIEKY